MAFSLLLLLSSSLVQFPSLVWPPSVQFLPWPTRTPYHFQILSSRLSAFVCLLFSLWMLNSVSTRCTQSSPASSTSPARMPSRPSHGIFPASHQWTTLSALPEGAAAVLPEWSPALAGAVVWQLRPRCLRLPPSGTVGYSESPALQQQKGGNTD